MPSARVGGDPNSVFIIAEVGVNHDGQFAKAMQLIEAAAAAGADAVKFQTFDPEELVSDSSPLVEYQRRSSNAKSQKDLLQNLTLSAPELLKLAEAARVHGLTFLSTAFDRLSLRFLVQETGMEKIKVPSGEITNLPYLVEAACFNLPLIVSTGMATLQEVRAALCAIAYGRAFARQPSSRSSFDDFARSVDAVSLATDTTLLHCTSEYPTEPHDCNIRAITTLRDSFATPVGFSDHSLGNEAAIGAVALGAVVLEKHITLDRDSAGPDHRASATPGHFSEFVRSIRTVTAAMGTGVKQPTDAESETAPLVRRSPVTRTVVESGEMFTLENLTTKRPEGNLDPADLWDFLGRSSIRPLRANHPLTRDDL